MVGYSEGMPLNRNDWKRVTELLAGATAMIATSVIAVNRDYAQDFVADYLPWFGRNEIRIIRFAGSKAGSKEGWPPAEVPAVEEVVTSSMNARTAEIKVDFKPPFTREPDVLVPSIQSIDVDRNEGVRFSLAVKEGTVTTTGCVVLVKTWNRSVILGIAGSLLAMRTSGRPR